MPSRLTETIQGLSSHITKCLAIQWPTLHYKPTLFPFCSCIFLSYSSPEPRCLPHLHTSPPPLQQPETEKGTILLVYLFSRGKKTSSDFPSHLISQNASLTAYITGRENGNKRIALGWTRLTLENPNKIGTRAARKTGEGGKKWASGGNQQNLF